MDSYLDRVVDGQLRGALSFAGAVLIEGPRACGKSATGRHHAESEVRLDTDAQALQIAELDPARLLRGRMPRFIDEWQLAPALWNHVRRAVDEDPAARFLLAGSAVPADDATRHSGAGRILRLRMRTMSLSESGHSTRDVSLRSLFEPIERVEGEAALDVEGITERVSVGGWPGLRALGPQEAQTYLRSYLDDVARVDLRSLAGEPARDPAAISRVLRFLGRSVATEARLSAIAADAGTEDRPLAHETVTAYLSALARVFVVEDQPSWGPHLRSRDRVRKAAKRHFVDPSLAAAALGADAARLLGDLELLGQLFESLVVRDLRVYSEPLDASVSHYRDSAGREVDAIIERRDGSWIACEVKLAETRTDEAAKSLHRFVSALDPSRTPAPSALLVITGGRYAYTRPDGVHVVPIGCLAP